MDGESLPNFPDEFRVRIGGNCVGAEIALGLLSDHIARGPPQSIGYCPPAARREMFGGNACQNKKSEEKAMNPRLIWTLGTGGVLLAGGIGLAIVMAEPTKGPVFIAGDKPVTEDQVRQKLQSDGWSNVQIARDGRYLEATGSKDGQTSKMEVDSQTGRLRADNDDDDDDDE
jgi:hypothetical protein